MFKLCIYGLLLSLLISIKVDGQTAAELEIAFKEDSPLKLKTFLDRWANELTPLKVKQRNKLSAIKQPAYAVFEALYNPHDLASRGSTQWGNDIYKDVNYFIIQDDFKIYKKKKVFYTEEEARDFTIDNVLKNVSSKYHEKWISSIKSGDKYWVNRYGPNVYTVWDDSLKVLVDSITNFRPNITETQAVPLYLNSKYNNLLENFLGDNHIPFATGGIMNVARAEGSSADRQRFLSKYLKIIFGHWGDHWDLLTGPTISAMVFDEDMKYVKVYYSMIYEGGEAFLQYHDNKWKLLSMKRTWRE